MHIYTSISICIHMHTYIYICIYAILGLCECNSHNMLNTPNYHQLMLVPTYSEHHVLYRSPRELYIHLYVYMKSSFPICIKRRSKN